MSWTPFRSGVSAQPLWRVARASRMNEASLDDNEERLSYGVLRGCMFFNASCSRRKATASRTSCELWRSIVLLLSCHSPAESNPLLLGVQLGKLLQRHRV